LLSLLLLLSLFLPGNLFFVKIAEGLVVASSDNCPPP
jgi:hypothetical protein